MARAFAWRDFLTLVRYRDRELFLDNSLGLTQSPGIISNVMLSLLFPASGFCTTVQPGEDESHPLFGQLHCSNAKRAARLTFLAPKDGLPPDRLVKLFSTLSQQAGELGAFQVLAEIERDSTVAESLRKAGFQPYAEQHIWQVPESLALPPDQPRWVPIAKGDEPAIQHLYGQVIPRNVQRVEPAPRVEEIKGWAYREDDRLRGFASFQWGPKGVLADLVLDPDLSAIGAHIATLFDKLAPFHRGKFYFRVRTYQQQIASALGGLGASRSPAQLAMVKHLAIQYQVKKIYHLAHLEKQPDITTPFVKMKINQTNYDQ